MIMLLTPAGLTDGLEGMDLLQISMQYHFGEAGVVFIAVILWLFSFSTFIGSCFMPGPTSLICSATTGCPRISINASP